MNTTKKPLKNTPEKKNLEKVIFFNLYKLLNHAKSENVMLGSLNRIVVGGLAGSKPISELNVPELFKLLTIHLTRFHHALIALPHVSAADHGSCDTIGLICEQNNKLGTPDEQILRANYLCYSYSSFIFPNNKISHHEIRAVRRLVQDDFIHFPPVTQNAEAVSLFYSNRPPKQFYSRDELSNFCVLINTPAVMSPSTKEGYLKFPKNESKRIAYIDAVGVCTESAKEIFNVDPQIIPLLYVSDIKRHIAKILHAAEMGSKKDIKKIQQLIGVMSRHKACFSMSQAKTVEFLEHSDVNAAIGEFLNISHMSKADRCNLLKLLCISDKTAPEIINHIAKMNILSAYH